MDRHRISVRTIALLFLLFTIPLFATTTSAQDDLDVLRVAFTQEPPILFDYFSDLGVAWNVMRIHSQPPWGHDTDVNLVPILVDELPSQDNGGVVQSDDGKTIISFTLADWAVWSDGTPITAADFELVFDVATDGLSNVLEFRFVNGAALDSVTQGETEKDVVITFAASQPDWTTAAYVPLPNHILREPYEEALADNRGMDTMLDYLRMPSVSNGPYVVAEWQSGSFLRYVRNENYWDDVNFDELIVSFYPDNNVIKQLLVNGETDFTFAIPVLEAQELVAENDGLRVIPSFTGGRMELRMNQGPNGHPALKDKTVRTALAMLIDRQFIADELYDGQNKVPRSFWDDTAWFYEDTPYVEYDVEAGLEVLREAGWYDDGSGTITAHGVADVEDGTPLELTASTYAGGGFTEYQDVLLTIQDMLSDIGIDVTITLVEVNVMHSTYSANSPYSTGQYDLYVQGWGVGVNTIDQLELWSCDAIPSEENDTGWNGIHACYPEMDELWDVLGTSLDADERQEAANQIQALMADENFTLFLVNLNSAFTLSTSLETEGLAFGGNTPWYGVNTWTRAG